MLLLGEMLRRRPSSELVLALALYSVRVLVLGRLALTRFDLVAGIAILLAGPAPAVRGARVSIRFAGALKVRAARGRAGADAADGAASWSPPRPSP